MQLSARRAVITVPIGVLRLPARAASAIRFDPPLKKKDAALLRLGAGPVVKLALHFTRAFSDEIGDGKYRDAALFQAPDCPSPRRSCSAIDVGANAQSWMTAGQRRSKN